MEILDLLDEKYSNREIREIKKLIHIQQQNSEKINNFKSIITLNDQLLSSLKLQLHSNNNDINVLNECFYENIGLFKHILRSLTRSLTT